MKKNFANLLIVSLLLGFLWASSSEGFLHRHYAGEDEQNCSYCHWDHTGAVGTWAPILMAATVFVRWSMPPFTQPIFPVGQKVQVAARGPPTRSI